MQSQCMLCRKETTTRCIVCKRYYCSTKCSKEDTQHKRPCRPPTDLSVETVVKTNAEFGIKVDPEEKLKVPTYKGDAYIAFPVVNEDNIPANVFDVRSEEMKGFCQHMGTTPKALETVGRRYWIKLKDYPMIMRSMSLEDQVKLLSKFHGNDMIEKIKKRAEAEEMEDLLTQLRKTITKGDHER